MLRVSDATNAIVMFFFFKLISATMEILIMLIIKQHFPPEHDLYNILHARQAFRNPM